MLTARPVVFLYTQAHGLWSREPLDHSLEFLVLANVQHYVLLINSDPVAQESPRPLDYVTITNWSSWSRRLLGHWAIRGKKSGKTIVFPLFCGSKPAFFPFFLLLS